MQVAETFSFEFLEEAVKIEEELSRSSTKDKKMQSKMASLLSKGGLPTVVSIIYYLKKIIVLKMNFRHD